mmetsp:Transcript_16008/g.41568  ORF Transcript_16008/g.41568 Transcript_16008/m.41568 type:complete len:330 (+) Transcript_16008:24-1013(+)|eukprot:jgi/Tetstr1/424424/TSEL_001445.t1
MWAKASQSINFITTMFVFWWSFPLSSAAFFVKWLNFTGKRNDMFQWSKFMLHFMHTRVKIAGTQRIASSDGKPMMYLANHRSWADFFIDVYILGGRTLIMSRMAVLFAFPVFMAGVIILKGVLLFRRDLVRDKEKFNSWLDEEIQQSLLNAMLVYPEGHRNIKPDALPLKRGMLHYAYSRKMPVQVVITAGKENVLSEKAMSTGFGQVLVTGFSDVIDPNNFKAGEDFITKVSEVFMSEWARVYGHAKKPESLPDYNPADNLMVYDYPFSMRLHLATTLVFCGYMLFLAGFLAVKVLGPALCVAFGVLSVSCLGYAHLYPELTHTGKNM